MDARNKAKFKELRMCFYSRRLNNEKPLPIFSKLFENLLSSNEKKTV